MGAFLTGQKLNAAVQRVLESPTVDCAVAFWGHHANGWFKRARKVRIICNLRSGCTDADLIAGFLEKRDKYQVRQCDRLHAKVYIGGDKAVVTSANASTNGIGSKDGKGWIEAGIFLDGAKKQQEWFNSLWDDAKLVREVTPADIALAGLKAQELAAALKDKPRFVVFYDDDSRSNEAARVLKESYSDKLDCYEDWPELPRQSLLFDYHVNKSKKDASFTGCWRTLPRDEDWPKRNGGVVQPCSRGKISAADRERFQSDSYRGSIMKLYGKSKKGFGYLPLDKFLAMTSN